MKLYRAFRLQIKSVTRSLQRFPLAVISALMAAVFFHIAVNHENTAMETQAFRWGLVFILGFFICLSAYLFIEGLKKNSKNRNMIIGFTWILVFIALGELYIRLVPRQNEIFPTLDLAFFYFGLLAVSGILVFFVGRFFVEEDYSAYVIDIISAIVVAFIYSVVLFTGLAFIALALNLLLGLFKTVSIYPILAFYSFLPFMASIFLSRFPKAHEDYGLFHLSPVITSLVKYIMIPLLISYTLILYIYLGKIVLRTSLPENSIVHLVFWSQLVSVGVLFLSRAFKKDRIIEGFRKYYPFASIPLVLLMFYALYLRLNQYGITENRYYIALFGFWILLSMIFFLQNRNKGNYQVIPQILVLLLFISVAGGPLSASDLSLRSQENRLIKILANNNMLRGNEIVATQDLDIKNQYEITQIVSYMHRHFDPRNISLLEDSFNIEDMEAVFGFGPQYDRVQTMSSDPSLAYSLDGRQALDIAGYDSMIRVTSPESSTLSESFVINRSGSFIEIKMIDDKAKLTDFTEIDLNLVRQKLSTLKNATYDIQPEDLAIEGENMGLSYKIYFTDLYFPNGNLDNKGAESASFILLIKELEGN